MNVIKRDGSTATFDNLKIKAAIEKAMENTELGVNEKLSTKISLDITDILQTSDKVYTVEEIQDLVEQNMMLNKLLEASKNYIIYRHEKNKTRVEKDTYNMLSNEFISKYKHMDAPMNPLGNLVFYRTYSRYLENLKRREYFYETIARAVDYNTSIIKTSKEEAMELYDNMFNLKQFLAGRTLWTGNTEASKKYPLSNFNCAFIKLSCINDFRDLFYLSMVGAGVGLRILKDDVKMLPKFKTFINLINEEYTPISKPNRKEFTELKFIDNDTALIVVGDSKEGWGSALKMYFELISGYDYKDIKNVVINYNNVRPKGERLKTFGGTASGHTSLLKMFTKINKIIKNDSNESAYKSLRPIDCLDIATIIGENVVSGGVRRTALITLIDSDDVLCIEAKNNLYEMDSSGSWNANESIIHRSLSNNSIYYRSKPSYEQLKWHLNQMRYSGEPGFVNEIAAAKRRDNMNGVNPCGEILLDSYGVCNLTSVNVFAFVNDGKLDEKGLLRAQELSARAGYRMTFLDLELTAWNNVAKRDRLVGCSLTGWQDMVNALSLSMEGQKEILTKLRDSAHKALEEYSKELGTNMPILVTTIKPEGTQSQLPCVSSGVHYSHSEYYIRRIRISSSDPILKVCEELGYPIFNEVGQTDEDCTTKVVEFPVKAPSGRTKNDVTAIEQLENYKLFMENYVDHNCSITVTVGDDEWDDVLNYVYENFDDLIAISFLPRNDSYYQLLPYEEITKEEYEDRLSKMKKFIPSLISKYEVMLDLELDESDCQNGVCPVR